MRSFPWMVVLLAVACAEDSHTECECAPPPADECLDSSRLREFSTTGTCAPGTGHCTYPSTEHDCEQGCFDGVCVIEDLCVGVLCDDPPSNSCADGTTLIAWETIGDCQPNGKCSYESVEQTCAHGCDAGGCLGQDLCASVTCDNPPASVCSDTQTVVEYQAPGVCTPSTGMCDYPSGPRSCDVACAYGRCATDKIAWGWIEIMERAPWYGSAAWARAYFALEPHFFAAPERMVDLRCDPIAREGDCTLYSNCTPFDQLCLELCAPDEECVWTGSEGVCQKFTVGWHAGEMSFEGLKSTINLVPDEYGRYEDALLPDDIFDPGAAITAHIAGGELGPFSISATGVAPLEVASTTVALTEGQAHTLSWTAADPGTRILTFIASGWHTPNPPEAALLCDSADNDGEVTVSRALVDGFLDRSGLLNRPSYMIRYTQTRERPFQDEIELTVGSTQFLELVLP
ncbi:hypothetical protein ACFL6C_08660 [Myxococcota bacterium]